MTDYKYSNNFKAQEDEFENDEDAEYLGDFEDENIV
jgi:hypothetical protein